MAITLSEVMAAYEGAFTKFVTEELFKQDPLLDYFIKGPASLGTPSLTSWQPQTMAELYGGGNLVSSEEDK